MEKKVKIIDVGWPFGKRGTTDRVIFIGYLDDKGNRKSIIMQKEEWQGKTPEEVYELAVAKLREQGKEVEEDKERRRIILKQLKYIMRGEEERLEKQIEYVERVYRVIPDLESVVTELVEEYGEIDEEEALELAKLYFLVKSKIIKMAYEIAEKKWGLEVM